MENLIFDGTRRLKLEMTSYSDNTYDVTNFLLFRNVLGLYSIPTKFHCCQMPNGRVKLGGFFAPVHYRITPDPIPSKG